MSGEDDRNRKYLEEAIAALQEQARAAAGDKDVSVMGGASIGQQYIAAGLVDDSGGAPGRRHPQVRRPPTSP